MSIQNIRICLVVDKHTYPQRKVFPSRRKRELIQMADAFEVKYPPFLRGTLDLRQKGEVTTKLKKREEALLQEVVSSGKEIIYHHGGGIVEDHVRHVLSGEREGKLIREEEIIEDEGLMKFIEDGYLEVLGKLGINFSSFNLGAAHRGVYVDTRKIIGENEYRWWVEQPVRQEDWLGIFRQRLEMIRNRYHGILAFENIPLHPHFDRKTTFICEPDFIAQVFKSLENIYFLLDICHARITANVTNMTIEEMADKLPIDKVKEVHLSGVIQDGTNFEEHTLPEKRDLDFLKWLIKVRGMNPEFITLEHYNEDNLIRSINEVKNLLAGL